MFEELKLDDYTRTHIQVMCGLHYSHSLDSLLWGWGACEGNG